jgi:hypothetical protein
MKNLYLEELKKEEMEEMCIPSSNQSPKKPQTSSMKKLIMCQESPIIEVFMPNSTDTVTRCLLESKYLNPS